jgi:hypothetical protein
MSRALARAQLQSEGCEFDPRGGLVHDLFAVSASVVTSSESAEDGITRHQAKDNVDSYIHQDLRDEEDRKIIDDRSSSGWLAIEQS